MTRMKTYYFLIKPGIILGNILTTAAGFALASKIYGNGAPFHGPLFVATLLGLAFIIAAAGVYNNYLDRSADAKMKRTEHRPLARGLIRSSHALIFASLLLLIGVAILALNTPLITLTLALAGFVIYLIPYGFLKYRSFYGTFVGSLAGAIPPVVGYTAMSHTLDKGALLLFLVLILWQMPHFFAIALLHREDYLSAGVKALPLTHSLLTTKIHTTLYIIAFGLTATLLSDLSGPLTLAIALILGTLWLLLSLIGFSPLFQTTSHDERKWARYMFRFSLVVLMTLSLGIILDGVTN